MNCKTIFELYTSILKLNSITHLRVIVWLKIIPFIRDEDGTAKVTSHNNKILKLKQYRK